MDKNTEKRKLRQYLNGTYLSSETDEIYDCLLKEGKKQDAFGDIASEVWNEAMNTQEGSAERKAEYYQEAQRLLRRLTPERKAVSRKHLIRYSLSIAATLLLLVGSFYFMNYVNTVTPTFTEIKTSFGEKKQIILPDGSKVMLNACSQLTYPDEFTRDVRSVQLTGQAFFEVTHDESKPFFVKANDIDVKVLGTEFDVKAYSGDEMFSVAVKSGKVEVRLSEATLRLRNEEQVTLNTRSGELNTQKGNKHVATWRKGSFNFNRTPIRDVARELQRAYHCTIKFQEGQEFTNLISGEHDNQSLESILESLHYVSGLSYRYENGVIIIYK